MKKVLKKTSKVLQDKRKIFVNEIEKWKSELNIEI